VFSGETSFHEKDDTTTVEINEVKSE
jgi:hypothetical protein